MQERKNNELRPGEAVSNEMLKRFLDNLDTHQPLEESVISNTMISDEHEDIDPTTLREYHAIIINDTGYEWLLRNLRRDLTLSRADPDIMDSMRQNISHAMPTLGQMSRKMSPREVTVVYTLNWEVSAFFRQQKYTVSKAEALAGAITITGTSVDAQALSCQDYLNQTWPYTGLRILKMLQVSFDPAQEGKTISKYGSSHILCECNICILYF